MIEGYEGALGELTGAECHRATAILMQDSASVSVVEVGRAGDIIFLHVERKERDQVDGCLLQMTMEDARILARVLTEECL